MSYTTMVAPFALFFEVLYRMLVTFVDILCEAEAELIFILFAEILFPF